jgi:hypothetical protein
MALIPTYEAIQAVQLDGIKKGYFTDGWHNLLVNLIQQLQIAISNEGFVNPPVGAEDRTVLETSYGQPNGALAGTVIFAPDLVNGGTTDAQKGQLMVLLADGLFHPITNT